MASAVNHVVTGPGIRTGRLLRLHPVILFELDPAISRATRQIYDGIRDLTLICPHGHVEASMLADDTPFPEPASLLIIPDHYILRMLYSQGVPLEDLGIPSRDGTPVELDARRIWQRVCEKWYLFRGTPSGAWLTHELY